MKKNFYHYIKFVGERTHGGPPLHCLGFVVLQSRDNKVKPIKSSLWREGEADAAIQNFSPQCWIAAPTLWARKDGILMRFENIPKICRGGPPCPPAIITNYQDSSNIHPLQNHPNCLATKLV